MIDSLFFLVLLYCVYYLPILYLTIHKVKWKFSLLFLISLCISHFIDIDLTRVLLFFISTVLLHSLYKNDFPLNLENKNYKFNVPNFLFLLPIVILSKFFIAILTSMIVTCFKYLGINTTQKQMIVTDIANSESLYTTIFLFITISFIAPITEEIALRYFLSDFLLRQKIKLNVHVSVIVSSLIFAIMHDSIGGITSAFLSGILFNYIYNKFGLLYSIAVHSSFNLLAFILIQASGIIYHLSL